jgi:hypothetical protein
MASAIFLLILYNEHLLMMHGCLLIPGPDPPFGALQFTVDKVQRILLELDVCGYRTRSMFIAKVLFNRENLKDKNRRRCFQGYQGDIGSHREVISDQCVSFGLSTEYRIF